MGHIELLLFTVWPSHLWERVLSIPLCNRCMAGRCGSVVRFCCFRYLSNSWGIFPSISICLNPSSSRSTFVLSLQSSWVIVFKSIYCFKQTPPPPSPQFYCPKPTPPLPQFYCFKSTPPPPQFYCFKPMPPPSHHHSHHHHNFFC